MEKIYLTWRDIEDAIESIAYRIKTSKIEFSSITGLYRGGLVPAVMLSHKLNIPYKETPSIGNILVVDDICDSGNTLRKFTNEPNIYTATIHHKQSASVEPNFWYSLVQDKDWIVYPWERNDSETVADYKNK